MEGDGKLLDTKKTANGIFSEVEKIMDETLTNIEKDQYMQDS